MTRRRRGTTLLEVLFAIFVVAMCATVLAAATPTASLSRYKAQMMNKAAGIAQKELEAIRTQGFTNVDPTDLANAGLIDGTNPVSGGNTYTFNNTDAQVKDNPSSDLPHGSGTVTINSVNSGLVQVTVTVSWEERTMPAGGAMVTRSVTVGTLIANV